MKVNDNSTAYFKGSSIESYFGILSNVINFLKEKKYTLITIPSIIKKDLNKYFGLICTFLI